MLHWNYLYKWSWFEFFWTAPYFQVLNKKVLLHEHKRHTARCIARTHYVALSPDGGGGIVPHPVLGGGGRVPHPVVAGKGVPHPVLGGGYHIQSWAGGYPGYPRPDLGPSVDRLKILPSLILRKRAVKMLQDYIKTMKEGCSNTGYVHEC